MPEGTGADFELFEPEPVTLGEWVLNAPPMVGGEYLSPELLFKLRGVDHTELIETDPAALVEGTGKRRRLEPTALADVFGVEFDEASVPLSVPPAPEPSADEKPMIRPTIRTTKGSPRKKRGRATKTASDKKRLRKPSFRPTASAVRRLRKTTGLSRAAFAEELGVSVSAVAGWEAKSGLLKLQPRSLEALGQLYKAVEA